MSSTEQNDDPEARGLIAHSYDNLFQVRKRVRSISDIALPTRDGIQVNQIAVGLLAFVLAIIFYGLVLLPILLLTGIGTTWWLIMLVLFGPPVLAAQRIAKPMRDGKTIGGAFWSWVRFHVDDRVHRRGLPVPTPTRPVDVPILHNQREWQMREDAAALVPGEGDYSDVVTETRMRETPPLALHGWLQARTREHAAAEEQQRTATSDSNMAEIHSRRGAPASVVGLSSDRDTDPEK